MGEHSFGKPSDIDLLDNFIFLGQFPRNGNALFNFGNWHVWWRIPSYIASLTAWTMSLLWHWDSIQSNTMKSSSSLIYWSSAVIQFKIRQTYWYSLHKDVIWPGGDILALNTHLFDKISFNLNFTWILRVDTQVKLNAKINTGKELDQPWPNNLHKSIPKLGKLLPKLLCPSSTILV